MREDIENILKTNGVTPTSIRLLIYKYLQGMSQPVSLSDIEMSLESVDKSTISRTLSIFRDHHLVHSLNDGSGSVKYELCSTPGSVYHDDMHVHFRCEKCGETICFTEIKIPEVELPDGFLAHERSYVISGLCCRCSL